MQKMCLRAEDMLKKRLYFAHPVNVYDTELERNIVAYLEKAFDPGPEGISWEIENPNQPHHQVGYADWKKRLENDPTKQGGMSYYFDVVLPECHGCVALSFLDGKFGMGVAGEVKFFVDRGLPVFEVRSGPSCGSPTFTMWSFNGKEKELFAMLDPSLVLSIEETRARTWMSPKEYNKVKLPYVEAHRITFEHEKWTSEYIKSLKK
ncbi:MAG TPA: hypothetical protein VJB70_02925 [Candidatus Paceibacterota bacterium]